MKLYSVAHSPFAARIRIALRYKGLEYENLGLPADGLKSLAFLAINPIGKIPVLLTEDAGPIVESETILGYLEDRYPQPALVPSGLDDRTRMRTVIRILENYVSSAMFALFPLLNPSGRDAAMLQAALDKWQQGLGLLSSFIADDAYAAGDRLTQADCMVFPILHLCNIVGPRLTVEQPLAAFPPLESYFSRAQADPLLKQCHDEIEEGLKVLHAAREKGN